MKNLVYSVQGKGHPLILLHGWGMGSFFLKPLAVALSSFYKVYLIDLPGYGGNEIVPCPADINDLLILLQKALPPKAIWVGWSLGGLIAQKMACGGANLEPGRQQKVLITLNSSPAFMEEKKWPGLSKNALTTLFNQVKICPQTALRRFIFWQLSVDPSWRWFCKNVKNFPPVSAQALLKGLEWLQAEDLRLSLYKISCPTLRVFGKHDPLIPKNIKTAIKPYLSSPNFPIPQSLQQNLQQPALQSFELMDGAHVPFLTHKNHCTQLIHTFIQGAL